ncbi:MAG: hypothetical protein GXP03_10160 [Alphaproteobacteria bacterium]|nr:hypothetical protein [Alphaproteobacteria bacterium]
MGGFDAPGDYANFKFLPNSRHYLVKVAATSGTKTYSLGIIQLVDGPDVRLEDILSVSVASLPAVDLNAAQSASLAQQWAEEAEDLAVTTGKYSALHHSAKSQASAADALASAQAAQAGDPPALSITMTGYTPVDVLTGSMADWSDGGVNMRMIQPSLSWYNEARPSGSWLGEAADETAARALTGAGTGDYYHNTTDGLFYSLDATSGETEIFRGARQGFPEEYAVVAEADRVIIFDVNDNNAMWMAFTAGTTTSIYVSAGNINAVTMVDGFMLVGTSGTASGLSAVHFLFDGAVLNQSTGHNQARDSWVTSLANRNSTGTAWITGQGFAGSAGIIQDDVNAVAITALPDAPINQTTGMPEPTIAVGTNGGTSVINNDGTVADSNDTNDHNSVAFLANSDLFFGRAGTDWVFRTSDYSTDGFASSISYQNTTIPSVNPSAAADQIQGMVSNVVLAWNTGLTHLKENSATLASGMVAYQTSDWFSGWLAGDILGAWLADTTVETLTASNIATHTFAGTGNLDGWAVASTATDNSGVDVLDVTTGGGSNSVATRTIAGLTVGQTYIVKFDRVLNTNTSAIFSTTSGGGSAYTTDSTGAFTFTATATSELFAMRANTSGVQVQFDNFSVDLADPDRSVKGNGLQVFGSLTKAVVATGADPGQTQFFQDFTISRSEVLAIL